MGLEQEASNLSKHIASNNPFLDFCAQSARSTNGLANGVGACLVRCLQRGPSGCLPALKKLCAQEVSLFCVFKISAGMPGSVICGFPDLARREKFVFQCRLPGGTEGRVPRLRSRRQHRSSVYLAQSGHHAAEFPMSAFGGKADIPSTDLDVCF